MLELQSLPGPSSDWWPFNPGRISRCGALAPASLLRAKLILSMARRLPLVVAGPIDMQAYALKS